MDFGEKITFKKYLNQNSHRTLISGSISVYNSTAKFVSNIMGYPNARTFGSYIKNAELELISMKPELRNAIEALSTKQHAPIECLLTRIRAFREYVEYMVNHNQTPEF